MIYKDLKQTLSSAGYTETEINNFTNYLTKLETSTNSRGEKVCKWFPYLTVALAAELYSKVKAEGLTLDGKHITIVNRGGGISVDYDYIAIKNKLLVIYPETRIDFDIVYKDDTFKFYKQNGQVIYEHNINGPFRHKDNDIIGAYCVIRNKRGEFILTLDRDELNQLRQKARTDDVWQEWFRDMCVKSVIRKLLKKHFDDVYTPTMEEEENKQTSLEQPIPVEITETVEQEIQKITTLEDLKQYYLAKSKEVKDLKSLRIAINTKKKKIISDMFDQLSQDLSQFKQEQELEQFLNQKQPLMQQYFSGSQLEELASLKNSCLNIIKQSRNEI